MFPNSHMYVRTQIIQDVLGNHGRKRRRTAIRTQLEVRRVERRGDVGHRHAEQLVDGAEEPVEGRDDARWTARAELRSLRGARPRQERVVVVHADDRDVRPRRQPESLEDLGQVRADVAERVLHAGRVDPCLEAAADLEIVGADVDRDQLHRPAVLEEERDGVGQLHPQAVLAPAVARPLQHVRRGLGDGAAELLQLEVGGRGLQSLVELVGVPVRGRVIDAVASGLHPHRQGVAQRQVPDLPSVVASPEPGRPWRRGQSGRMSTVSVFHVRPVRIASPPLQVGGATRSPSRAPRRARR